MTNRDIPKLFYIICQTEPNNSQQYLTFEKNFLQKIWRTSLVFPENTGVWTKYQIILLNIVSVRSTASIWIKDICIFNREKKVFCGTFRRKLYGFGENWKDPTKKNLHEIDFVFSIFQKKISIHILIQLFIILRAFSLYVEF